MWREAGNCKQNQLICTNASERLLKKKNLEKMNYGNDLVSFLFFFKAGLTLAFITIRCMCTVNVNLKLKARRVLACVFFLGKNVFMLVIICLFVFPGTATNVRNTD